jgi:hypothetical protein
MTTINNIRIESENLLQTLEGLKFFADANSDALNKNPVFLEFVAFKMDIARGFIEELQIWETLENQSKCDYAIENARFFLEQIQVLMDRMLNQQYEEVLLCLQKQPRLNNYVFESHNDDLSRAIIYLPQAA